MPAMRRRAHTSSRASSFPLPGASLLLWRRPDRLGSARRVFASTSSAPAYSYDPYGNPLQVTAPFTDFGYAGMFANADSGLYLTLFRAYDPVAGPSAILDAVRKPIIAVPQPNGTTRYVGKGAVVVLNPAGRVVTIWGPIGHIFTR
jgi:hypothetical protein